MKYLYALLIAFIVCGCANTVSLTQKQQQSIKDYVQYCNYTIEDTFKDEQPRKHLQPYRVRYRFIQQVLSKFNK